MFEINDAVCWTSSNTKKQGIIVAVVPAGQMPSSVGYPKLGKNATSRGHESYIVRGGEKGRPMSTYWPTVSLLTSATGLSPSEVAWCHANPRRIRAMMSNPS